MTMRLLALSLMVFGVFGCAQGSHSPAVVAVQGTVAVSTMTAQPDPAMSPTATVPPGSSASPVVTGIPAGSLHQAAERGDRAEVARLIAAGADINGRDARGRTPLLAATHGNQPAVVAALIAAGADLDRQDDLKDTPFLYAGASGFLEIVQLTHQAGASTRITNRFGGTALIPAAERGHVEVVQYLITSTDIAIDHVNNLGWTALLEAIVLGDGGPRRTDVVRLLVAAGANVNLPDRGGVTPLAHARQRGYREMIDVLQRAGAR